MSLGKIALSGLGTEKIAFTYEIFFYFSDAQVGGSIDPMRNRKKVVSYPDSGASSIFYLLVNSLVSAGSEKETLRKQDSQRAGSAKNDEERKPQKSHIECGGKRSAGSL